jgi:hypothetical protein
LYGGCGLHLKSPHKIDQRFQFNLKIPCRNTGAIRWLLEFKTLMHSRNM